MPACTKALRMSGRLLAVALAAAASLVFAASASASPSPTPPFTQCPPVGLDTSCGTLIEINQEGAINGYNDPTQGPFDGIEDTLIGVQNNSREVVHSIKLTGSYIFGFDGDGLCTASPQPSGCPFGPTGYEGPGTSFETENYNEGNVVFIPEGLAPGASTYFSLEEPVRLSCTGNSCKQIPTTSLYTSLSGSNGQTGSSIKVPANSAVTDSATLSGENAGTATGTVTYKAYSDPNCSTLVGESTVSVNGSSVPASSPETIGGSPGSTLYWTASYSGDENNQGSSSGCGNEVATVPYKECHEAIGIGHYGAKGPEGLNLDNNLTTNLEHHQLEFTTPGRESHAHLNKGGYAICEVVSSNEEFYYGYSTGKWNGESGYEIVYEFILEPESNEAYFATLVTKEGAYVYSTYVPLNKPIHEHIN